MIALFAAAALAAGGTYHADDIAEKSVLFGEASAVAGKAFEARQDKAEALARALDAYQVGLDLLGDRAPAAERTRYEALRKEYGREHAVLDAFASTMMDDFDGEFTAALGRALKAYPGAVDCEREIADTGGMKVPGRKAPTKPNPDCTGQDLNDALAKAMDADPKLNSAVKEILALQWPDVDLAAEAQPAIGTGERAIAVTAVFDPSRNAVLKKIQGADDEGREGFQAKIEQGASKDELAAMVAESEKITAATAAKRASYAAPILAVADKTLAKWAKKGEPATAWCANPVLLGGCAVPDATKDVVPRMIADKKVAKVLGS